jgi:hypothetical protein
MSAFRLMRVSLHRVYGKVDAGLRSAARGGLTIRRVRFDSAQRPEVRPPFRSPSGAEGFWPQIADQRCL